MGVSDAESDRMTDASDGEDESSAVLRTVGKVIKVCRERRGLSRAELGSAIGYGDELVSSVELGRRVPKPEFLEAADRVLEANGLLIELKKDVQSARYPKKVRDLLNLEAEAMELGAYESAVVHGVLQTEEYMRALFETRRPSYTEDEIERLIAARKSRQAILTRLPPPTLTFVQDEATLRRPIGGTIVLRQQLEQLLEMGRLRHVDIQVMPLEREDNPGISGSLQVLKLKDGSMVGHNEVQLLSRVVSNPRDVQILDMRYGVLRSHALSPRDSLSFIEEVLGET